MCSLKKMVFGVSIACAGMVAMGGVAGGRELSYPDIVRRLYTLEQLALPPVTGEQSGCVSSFDRASVYDAASGLYRNWHANNDGSGCVRREGEWEVAADLKGPGVIWRIWSADPKDGLLKIVIDGQELPAVNIPFKRLFDQQHGLFPCRELVRDMARGKNCFIPIPYQRSCKVMLGKGWGRYYQITYTTFPDDFKVPSFTGVLPEVAKSVLAEADKKWAERGWSGEEAESERFSKEVALPGSSEIEVLTLKGTRAITGLKFQLEGVETAVEMERALRELTISIYWDGDDRAAVWSPLGDFFGSGPGVNPYRSLAAGMTKDGMYSKWYMPFGSQARIVLQNDGAKERKLACEVLHQSLAVDADKLLRFHAKWHRGYYGKAGADRYFADRWPDWPMLLAEGGAGRFCGVALTVWNPLHIWDGELRARYEATPPDKCSDEMRGWMAKHAHNYWWGEGDEKFFVDGELFPSTFGTGSEDYFGYAWGTPRLYDSATQSQTRNVNNVGWISMARWQIADNVPFQSRFEGCIEKYHGDNWPLKYAATVYWYQVPGVSDAYPVVPVEERLNYDSLPEIK